MPSQRSNIGVSLNNLICHCSCGKVGSAFVPPWQELIKSSGPVERTRVTQETTKDKTTVVTDKPIIVINHYTADRSRKIFTCIYRRSSKSKLQLHVCVYLVWSYGLNWGWDENNVTCKLSCMPAWLFRLSKRVQMCNKYVKINTNIFKKTVLKSSVDHLLHINLNLQWWPL